MPTRPLLAAAVGLTFGLLAGCGTNAANGAGGGGTGVGGGSGAGGGTGVDESAIYQSGSRIKARVGTTPDGAKTFIGWYDSTLQSPCSFIVASDGTQRCLPGSYTGNPNYGDATCTQMVILTTLTCTPPKYTWVYKNKDLCSAAFEVHPVNGPHDGGYFFRLDDGGCAAAGAPGPGYSMFELGGESAPTGFVPMTESLE